MCSCLRCGFACFFYLQWSICSAQQGIAYPPNPNAYSYFLSPSSYPAEPGKAMIQSGMLAAWQYQKTTPRGNSYAIGMIPTLLLGESEMPIWVSAHRRIPIGARGENPGTIANVGGFFLSIPGGETEKQGRDVCILYTNFNFGNREKNFALGAAVLPTGLGSKYMPQAITLHGMTRLGPRSCLITENYLIHDQNRWITCSLSGYRFWRKRTAFDISLLLVRFPEVALDARPIRWLPLPWIAFHHTLKFDLFQNNEE